MSLEFLFAVFSFLCSISVTQIVCMPYTCTCLYIVKCMWRRMRNEVQRKHLTQFFGRREKKLHIHNNLFFSLLENKEEKY